MEPPRFAVDRMLGRLARWLRLLGFDACYRADLPGRRLLTLAAREERVVLTRDTQLERDVRLRRASGASPIVHIASDHFRDQLRELDRQYPLGAPETRQPRCAECNQALEDLARDQVSATVPPYVHATQTSFQRCPRCRRVYWPATHWERMNAEIAALGLTRPRAIAPSESDG